MIVISEVGRRHAQYVLRLQIVTTPTLASWRIHSRKLLAPRMFWMPAWRRHRWNRIISRYFIFIIIISFINSSITLQRDRKTYMLKIPIKRVDSTYRKVDAIPQIVHCLQPVEVNLQFGLDWIEPNYSEAVFTEKRRVGDPMLELNITLLSYLIVDAENWLSVPKTANADECFPN